VEKGIQGEHAGIKSPLLESSQLRPEVVLQILNRHIRSADQLQGLVADATQACFARTMYHRGHHSVHLVRKIGRARPHHALRTGQGMP
jgi:hypothetical protein